MKNSFIYILLFLMLVGMAVGSCQQALPSSEPPNISTPVYSEGKVVSLVDNWLLAQAETQQAREIIRKEIAKLQASYNGGGIWEASGDGKWKIFEESGIVQPIDEKARDLLQSIIDANQQIPIAETPTPFSKLSANDAVERVRPAVVRIVTESGMGSGIIIDETGYVLTNNHVVQDSHKVMVVLIGGQEFSASVLGRDEIKDLAVLKINAENLPTAVLGESDKLELTEDVIAIGYPLDLEGSATVSRGITSAFRNYAGVDYIQTDTAINPGNSGGPLINLEGEVVGINVLTIRVASGLPIEGMNFAIAINSVKSIIPKLIVGISVLKPIPEPEPLLTYTDTIRGFTIQYPNTWKIIDISETLSDRGSVWFDGPGEVSVSLLMRQDYDVPIADFVDGLFHGEEWKFISKDDLLWQGLYPACELTGLLTIPGFDLISKEKMLITKCDTNFYWITASAPDSEYQDYQSTFNTIIGSFVLSEN
jgi:S1-C subfamily serine protease